MALSTIKTNSIDDSAITADKIANTTITGAKIANTTIEAAQIANTTITGAKIANTTIENGQIANSTIASGKLAFTAKEAGKESIWVPANAMYPNSTNGCADIAQTELGNGPELKTLDFDKDSDEFAQFAVAFPKSWNEGTITYQAFFTAASTNTGDVVWTLAGTALADNGSLNTAFGTAVATTAKAHSGTSNDLDVTAESGAVTISNAAVDTQTYFQIMRDVSADDQSGDARLLGIKLFFTTDAANDS